MSNWLDEVKFDSNGLIPAIAQHHQTGRILMVAWMNREALALTAEKIRLFTSLALAKNFGTRVKNQAISKLFMKFVWTVTAT